MRHYEIILLVHPDQSEQVAPMCERYENIIKKQDGKIHRKEDIGRRQLGYGINDVHKAHYVLYNIECKLETLRELEEIFKFNDSILRHLVVKQDSAITGESALSKKESRSTSSS